jgi:predicted Rdx family selenoprotein
MRGLVLVFASLATPAFAHHEVVMTTSLVPLLGGLFTILVAARLAWKQRKRGPR